jgi:hypothetical protein
LAAPEALVQGFRIAAARAIIIEVEFPFADKVAGGGFMAAMRAFLEVESADELH